VTTEDFLKNQCIIALDHQSSHSLGPLLDNIQHDFSWVKVGMELFYAQGHKILESLHQRNFKIFLDLKLYDIPQTVHNAILSLNHLPFDLLTIHLQGGVKMINAAGDAIKKHPLKAKLLGVSVLTSFDEATWNKTQTHTTSIKESIQAMISQDIQSSLYGVVSSGHEIVNIKKSTSFKAIVPGIRWSKNKHDQARVMTPAEALHLGADYLVIGREITGAENIQSSIQNLKDHLNEHLFK
jgi:orotidine-5'-phosphate decarboxylase